MKAVTASESAPPSESEPAAAVAKPAKKADRIEHQFYQTATHVTVDILIKKVDKANATIEFGDASCSVDIKLHTGAHYNLELDLCHTIVPAESSFKVMGTKVTVKMKKKSAIQWKALEGDGTDGTASSHTMVGGNFCSPLISCIAMSSRVACHRVAACHRVTVSPCVTVCVTVSP
jgi:hypothetical protein